MTVEALEFVDLVSTVETVDCLYSLSCVRVGLPQTLNQCFPSILKACWLCKPST